MTGCQIQEYLQDFFPKIKEYTGIFLRNTVHLQEQFLHKQDLTLPEPSRHHINNLVSITMTDLHIGTSLYVPGNNDFMQRKNQYDYYMFMC